MSIGINMSTVKCFSRRRFISLAAFSLPIAINPSLALAITSATSRQLDFYHTHTGKKLAITYHDGYDYIPDALTEVNHFLGDFRTGDIFPIDIGLLDILQHLKTVTGSSKPFEIISGYRSPKTNAGLRNKSNGGVAKFSQHMLGKAVDVRLRDIDTKKLRNAAIAMKSGGVGYYAKSDFVHLDTGRVRRW